MCTTCDFAFPGDVHLCPECASKPQGLSPKRKRLVIGAYAMGVISLLSLVGIMALGAMGLVDDKSSQGAAAVLGGLVMFVSAIVGTSLGVGALDRRLGNPLSVWIAAIFNGIILAILILLVIVGNLS